MSSIHLISSETFMPSILFSGLFILKCFIQYMYYLYFIVRQLQRMVVAMAIAGLAFVVAGFVELKVQADNHLLSAGHSKVVLTNTIQSPVTVVSSDFNSTLNEVYLVAYLAVFIQLHALTLPVCKHNINICFAFVYSYTMYMS